VLQFGFGFKYKGWENSLSAIASLKEQFPDIFFTGLFSVSPHSLAFHDQYHAELQKFIAEKGIISNVGLIKGYQSQETLESFIRVNNVAIFPYVDNPEHRVYGCSGAARLAMHYGIPTIVSDIPLFEDLEGVCPRVSSVEDLCAEIKKMLDPAQAKLQVARQSKFLSENSWKNSAERYLDILR
jgi:glycosyltransferase involved in cell wall biosynthesis